MLTTTALFLSLLQTPHAEPQRPFALMLGDPAPAIQVAEWVQGTPLTSFERGKIYVVEFWATWCGPCKVAIPHLNELSKLYAGKVEFIGVSVSENIAADQPYWVPRFVQEMGDKMTYTVAADRVKADDPHRMNEGWMRAAGQGGIPTAFIVSGAGKIAWIGHPMAMDAVLPKVVDGTWDLEKAARDYAAEMQRKGFATKLNREISKAKKERDYATALRVLDEALGQDPMLETSFGLEKYFLLLEVQRSADAATYGRRLVSEVIASNPMALNQLAWTIVDPQGKWKTGDYDLATRAAERAVELQEGKDASTLDTLGLALFKLGRVARAIEVQQKAVELAKGKGQLEEELRGRLEEFQRASQDL